MDIGQSLNSRDSFPRRKFKNRAQIGCSPGPILSPPTITFELHAKTAEEIEKCTFRNFGSSVTLSWTLDRVEVTQRTSTKNKLNPGLVASYDLQPGNGAGPIFWKVRDRRRNRREGKTHKKGRRKNTNRKGKQNKNTNKPHSHSAEINK